MKTILRVISTFLLASNAVFAFTATKAQQSEIFQGLQNTKLIRVGSLQAVEEFATQLDINPSLCFADEGGVAGDTLGLEKGLNTMWNPPAVDNMMARNDEKSLKSLGEAYKAAVDNIGFKKLAPEDLKDTLRQGGTFVFKGNTLLLEHYDQKVGDNCKIDDILQVL